MRIHGILLIYFVMSQVLYSAEHPHLLFGKNDLPVLRQKILEGVPKVAWSQLQQRCVKHLALTVLPPSSDLDAALDPLTELAFAWQLSQQENFRDKFKELIAQACTQKTNLPALYYDTALIFDFGFDLLTQEQIDYLKGFLLKARENARNGNKALWFPFSNWGLIPGMTGVREAAVLYGHPEYDPKILDSSAALARDCLSCFIDDAGYPCEGGDYLNYPFYRVGGLSLVMLKRKGYDLITGTNISKIPLFLLNAGVPGKNGPTYFPLGDSGKPVLSSFTMRVLLSLMPDHTALHVLAELYGIELEQRPDAITGIILHMPLQKQPVFTQPQNSVYDYEAGIVTYKSDATSNAFHLASLSRRIRGHAHEDAGTFILHAGGEEWLTDPGYGEGSLMQHNMVAIDQDGPQANGAPPVITQVLLAPSGIVKHTDLHRFWNYFRQPSKSDPLTYAPYPVQRVERCLIVIPADVARGLPPFGFVSDTVVRDEAVRDYAQIFQIPADKNITLQQAGATVEAKGAGQMKLLFLAPKEAVLRTDLWQTYGRFAGRKFQRVVANVKGRYGRFLTIFYPQMPGMPDLIARNVPSAEAVRRLDWANIGTDYLVYTTPERELAYDLLFLRVPASARFDAPPLSYVIVAATGKVVQQTRELLSLSSCYDDGLADQVVASAVFGAGELHLDIYTSPLCVRQIRQLVRITAFAPGVEKVFIGGRQVSFERADDSIKVIAYSRLVAQEQERINQKWERLMQQIEASRNYIPSAFVR